jgi:hypothetical protein
MTYLVAVAVAKGRQLGDSLALAQVRQHEQGLLARVELALARADHPASPPDDPGDECEGLAGQRQYGRVESIGAPRGRCGSWSIAHLPGVSPHPKATCRI